MSQIKFFGNPRTPSDKLFRSTILLVLVKPNHVFVFFLWWGGVNDWLCHGKQNHRFGSLPGQGKSMIFLAIAKTILDFRLQICDFARPGQQHHACGSLPRLAKSMILNTCHVKRNILYTNTIVYRSYHCRMWFIL